MWRRGRRVGRLGLSARGVVLITLGIMAINVSTLVTFIPAVQDVSKLGLTVSGELIALAAMVVD